MAPGKRIVRFGPFAADLATGELHRDGQRVELQELPFQVLAALLERPGQLVTRDELRSRVWPADVYVDFEHGLNKAVNKIRQALGDSAGRPRYLETLPRRGYRFVAAVEASPTPRMACRILWDARTIPLVDGVNVIGRDPDSVVWVDSSTVSRRHARITVSADGAVLEDLGSKNGTVVSGRPVHSAETLRDGDEIVVGSARMTFRASAATGSTRTASR